MSVNYFSTKPVAMLVFIVLATSIMGAVIVASAVRSILRLGQGEKLNGKK